LNLVLAVSEACVINFTMDVTAVPAGGSTFGIGFATAHGNVTTSLTGTGSGSTQTTVESCAVTLDKQVSCDGGTTWQDTTGADDAGGTNTNGCVATTGTSVMTRFVVNNTGTAPVSCTLSDTPAAGNPKTFLAGNVTITNLAAAGNSTTTGTANTCDLTFGQNGTNTANLTACSCPSGTGPIAIPDSHDTATFACAGVKIDKEISCDAGVTFQDAAGGSGAEAGTGLVTANQGGTLGCVGKVGAAGQIEAKFAAKNTGNVNLNCSLSDTNTNFIPSLVSGIALNSSTVSAIGPGTTAGMECNAARSVTGVVKEPNTSTLTCTINSTLTDKTTAGSLTVFDSATFDCCGVAIDKQVSCNGGAFTDIGFGDATIGSCSALNGQPVAIQYVAKNTGSLPLTCDPGNQQGLIDVNASGAIFGPSSVSVAVNTTTSPIINPNVNVCSATLNTNEQLGNTASISCTCDGGTNEGTQTASDLDTARIICGSPSFTSTKTCTPTAPNSTTFNVDVNVVNNGNADLSCTATDALFSGLNGACPPTAPSIPGPTLITQPLLVPQGTNGNLTGQFSSQTSTCNQATVTCVAGAGGANPQTLPTQSPFAACPVVAGGCFTRTPGYWGTHPAQTLSVIGAGLPVCGITLTNFNAPSTNGSAVEDLCGTGGPDFKPNNTSPQQLQLIRQCTSAALNLRVSAQANLNCDGAFPDISAIFNTCCVGPTSTCDSGLNSKQLAGSTCEAVLDAFNNQFDGTNFPNFLVNSPAKPASCQIANGDGEVNAGRKLGGK
jgi:hypothetical protein